MKENNSKKIIWVTKDFSGLGFALRTQEEGYSTVMAIATDEEMTPEHKEGFDNIGEGMIKKYALKDLLKKRANLRDYYWIWDGNHNVETNELLRKEGFKVLMGGEFNNIMEHDRSRAASFMKQFGVISPPTFPFTDTSSAIQFCEQNPEIAYVFKPDEGENFETWVPESEYPEDANKEIVLHLNSISDCGSFILQERKEGVEANVEVWFVKGEPKFAYMNLECKKKLNQDLGEMAGCAMDFGWEISLNSEAIKQTIAKLYPYYKKIGHTGFVDVNVIFAKDGVWYFESCNRFGYNAHPNLLFNLNQDKLGETLTSMIDGNFKPNFSKGFGASATMYTDHPKCSKFIQFPEKLLKNIYFWDVYKKKDLYLTAGYDNSILIALGFGYTIPTAWENCLMFGADKIKFPGRSYRTDGDKTNYLMSPIRRYEAICSMKLI